MPNRNLETIEQDDELKTRRDEIAQLAYSYWQDRGGEDGHDVEDWLMAEQEILSRPAPRSDDRRREARTAA